MLRAIEWRLDRNEDDVGLAEGVVVGRRFQASVTNSGSELPVGDIADIARALSELRDPFFVEVERDDGEATTREGDGKRESDVPATDDGDARRPVRDLLTELDGAHDASGTR